MFGNELVPCKKMHTRWIIPLKLRKVDVLLACKLPCHRFENLKIDDFKFDFDRFLIITNRCKKPTTRLRDDTASSK